MTKKIIQKGLSRLSMKLTPDQVKVLQQIDFDFLVEVTSKSYAAFRSCIEALKRYRAKHGHTNFTEEEDKSFFVWIGCIRRSFRIQKKGRLLYF